MAAISKIEAIKRLKRGDMIQVTLRDPRKDSDRDRFTFCKSRGGGDEAHIRRHPRGSGATDGWVISGRSVSNVCVGR